MTLPGRGADLWVGWLSILRLVHQRSHDMSFQHIIHVTTYRWCYTPIAAISSDIYPSLIVVVRFLQLFSASGGNIPSWNTIASLHPVGMYSLPKLYRFVVISSPGHWFWPYPLINRRFRWYSTRKCGGLTAGGFISWISIGYALCVCRYVLLNIWYVRGGQWP